jgi:hypothetical protein
MACTLPVQGAAVKRLQDLYGEGEGEDSGSDGAEGAGEASASALFLVIVFFVEELVEVDDFLAGLAPFFAELLELVVVMVSRLPLLQAVKKPTETRSVVMSNVFIGWI